VVICCLLPLRAQTTLALVDVSGRTVRRLHDQDLPAGETLLSWDGRDDGGREVPAGVYLVKVTKTAGATTGRVVLAN
jgi:flagellar hook assembly protein FlgD